MDTELDAATARPARTPRRYDKTRMEAFSDGVFAFAITLLVLDIVIPSAEGDRDLLAAFLEQWPEYVAYVVSFATIGAIWLAHNSISEHLTKVDSTYMRLNLVLLLFVAFTPFPTRFLSQYIQVQDAERVAVTIYGIAFLVLALIVVCLWVYAKRAGLLTHGADDDKEVAANSQRLPQGLIAYPVLIVVGLFWPMVAVFGYLALALYFMIPFRIRRRRQRAAAAAAK
ncbi:TMEM175 family protein [Microbacterium sp. KR10-403]|uniref:TMEM175 family protein n=1 Tax=Microbacterium sp. KR10-403 TaxID=3158581 RepID=UPI0032E46317